MRAAPATVLLLAATLGAAAAADRPPGCDTALQALEQAEAGVAAARPGRATASSVPLPVPPALAAARRRAAQACLGAAPPGAPRTPQDAPPVRVPPVAPAPGPGAVPGVFVPPSPQPRPAPPTRVMSCDGTGCWLDDGSRVPRAGPDSVIGPRGICSIRLGVLSCP